MRVRRRRPRLPGSIDLPRRWRRSWAGLIVVLIAAACVTWNRTPTPDVHPDTAVEVSAGPGSDFDRYHDQNFTVTRVIDGDTLDVDAPDQGKPTTRIRLWGVDTPEIAHGGQSTMHFGEEALVFARQTLEHRPAHVVLSPKRSRDKYGRLLAYVFVERGGRMFNEMLIEEGFGYADHRFAHHYKERFAALESQAKAERKGLWRDVTFEQFPSWRQRHESRAKSEGRDRGGQP